jgi:hypothetical protein
MPGIQFVGIWFFPKSARCFAAKTEDQAFKPTVQGE